MRRRQAMNQSGVTLIELLIATTIFSVILVIILYAFLFISNNYTKGLVESQTQETARAALEDISQDIQLDSADVIATQPASDGSQGICVGNHLYSYQFNEEIGTDVANGDVSHALVVDTVPGCDSSTHAQALSGALASGSKELLGNHMRLGAFSITPSPSASGQYAIDFTVAYGDLTTQPDSGPLSTTSSSAPYTYACASINVGGDFCADATLSTVVQQR